MRDVLIRGMTLAAGVLAAFGLNAADDPAALRKLVATNVVMRDCVVEGARDLLLLKMRVDTPQHFSNVRVENCRGTCRNFLNLWAWSQYADMKDSKDVPESVMDGLVMRGNAMTCELWFKAADINHARVAIDWMRFE